MSPEPSPKDILRTEALRHRARMTAENPEDVVERFFETLRPKKDAVIAGYWPKENEFDVKPLLDEILSRGYACALPVVEKDKRVLKFARWDRTTGLQKGAFGIHEPPADEKTEFLSPDIVIVPLLAFDRRGYRLGYGHGYYDATIVALRTLKDITTVGVGYAQQACLFNLPNEDHDQKLDWVITPQGVHDFKGV